MHDCHIGLLQNVLEKQYIENAYAATTSMCYTDQDSPFEKLNTWDDFYRTASYRILSLINQAMIQINAGPQCLHGHILGTDHIHPQRFICIS